MRLTTASRAATSSRRCSTSGPRDVTFFTDRDLGLQFPGILRASGLRVERHADHFAPDCPDEHWLREVARHGWIAITHDARIRYKPNERSAVLEHGLSLLVVVGAAPFPELARSFVWTVPRIVSFLSERTPPFIAKVYRASPCELVRKPEAPGRVELWYPKS